MQCPLMAVICPETNNSENGCPWWIVLNYGLDKVGRCSQVWNTTLLIEIRQAIDKLNPDMKKKNLSNQKANKSKPQKVKTKRKAK